VNHKQERLFTLTGFVLVLRNSVVQKFNEILYQYYFCRRKCI